MTWKHIIAVAGLLASALGCAERPSVDPVDAAPGDDAGPIEDANDDPQIVIDATDGLNWVYLRLPDAVVVTPATPEDSGEWDLAFSRFKIALNGGASGTGPVELAVVEEPEFDAVTEAPADGYVTDEPDLPDDEDEEPEFAFTSGDTVWFDYDLATHVLTPKPRVYVVRTVAGGQVKMQITSYYDDAGSSGFMHFRLEELN